jgi:hypothetical protein
LFQKLRGKFFGSLELSFASSRIAQQTAIAEIHLGGGSDMHRTSTRSDSGPCLFC